MRLVKTIANLGYGSRREVAAMFREGRITDALGEVLYADDQVAHADVRIDDEPLDPPSGIVVMLHKPAGYTCSTKDAGRIVYDLLPKRSRARSPVLSSVGRLDRETSGLLLFTDDGKLLHRIISPQIPYRESLRSDARRRPGGDEAAIFAAGTLMLDAKASRSLPAARGARPRSARLTLHEGRYHQVRRMFAAAGNHVETLHRPVVGGLALGSLAVGEFSMLGEDDVGRIFGVK